MEKIPKYHKVSFVVNPETKKIKIVFKPELDHKNAQDIQIFLNTVYTGTYMSFKTLLSSMPILRPASEREREAKVYIFKDPVRDNKLYKERKEMYDSFANGFSTLLREMFPDIEYIENSRIEEQHKTFDMNDDEAEERRIEIEGVAEYVRSLNEVQLEAREPQGDNDGDIPKGEN
jgi:hypothetical protein